MNFLRNGLVWLDASPSRYWIVAGTAFTLVWLLALAAPTKPGWTTRLNNLLFACTIFAALAAFRWPAWFKPGELNPDESQLIAGALTLARFPVYWQFVDGTTHGPLCEYPIVIASWFGAPFNYVTVRVIAALLQAGALIGIWGTLRGLTTERIARLAILPGLAFWAFVSWDDFAHYSTELPGIFLLAVAGWGLTAAILTPSNRRRHLLLYLGGLALGAVPFTKLQLVPQAAAMGGLMIVMLRFAGRPPLAALVRRLFWLVLGSLTTALLVGLFLLAKGLTAEFWHAYILSNLGYTGMGHHPGMEMPSWFFHFSTTSFAFAWFLTGCVGFALLYARSTPARPPALRHGASLSWFLLGTAYLTVLSPNREVVHYLHILVVPATLLAGFILAGAMAEAAPAKRSFVLPAPVLAFSLIAVAPQIYDRAVTHHAFLGHFPVQDTPLSDAARFLREHARPGDTLAMWGWAPALYVETGLPQGTRESHTSFQLTTWPMQKFYLDRYLADLRQRPPAWFVDAVGPAAFIYENRDAFAHEKFAGVRDHIRAHYEFLAEFGNRRIYRLKPAAAE